MGKKNFDWKSIGKDKLIIIFLCGIFLLVLSLPTGSSKKEKIPSQPVKEEEKTTSQEEYTEFLEKRLKTMLSKMEGVKSAEVMITLKTSGEKVTLKDTPYTQETTTRKDDTGESTENRISGEETTVLVETKEGSEPYVVKEREPQVEGVLVLIEGTDNGALKNEISEAVEALFGVPSHKIKVMKMNDKQ